jgi:hypothetical protein
MRISLGAAMLLLPLAAAPARSQDRPQTLPSRDVDITYRLGQINPATAPGIIEQRMRWDVTGGRLRVDPPTPGLYVILDTRNHHMTTGREADHAVLELDGMGGANAPVPGSPPVDNGIPFIREGESRIASLTCTEWETKDLAGAPALVCITDDGVLLRAVTAGRTVLEATKVTYGPIDPSVFQVPANYVRLHPPPPAR